MARFPGFTVTVRGWVPLKTHVKEGLGVPVHEGDETLKNDPLKLEMLACTVALPAGVTTRVCDCGEAPTGRVNVRDDGLTVRAGADPPFTVNVIEILVMSFRFSGLIRVTLPP